MHREGLLHRDLKPDNMGILSADQPFVVLFDLGMTKMYTNEEGEVRFINLIIEQNYHNNFITMIFYDTKDNMMLILYN